MCGGTLCLVVERLFSCMQVLILFYGMAAVSTKKINSTAGPVSPIKLKQSECSNGEGMEKAVVVLDCRGSFAPFFESAKMALQTFVHEKLIHKPNHEVGLVIFGCDRTNNPLFDGTNGDAYEHVAVAQSLETVGVDLLKTLQRLPPPTPGSDIGSMAAAVRVAGEVLNSSTEQKKKAAKRRIVVLSTFESEKNGEAKGTIEEITNGLTLFTLIRCLNAEEARCTGDHWTEELGKFVQVKSVRTLYQLQTCFPIKENKDAHTLYSHTMKLGNSLEIPVKVILKLKKEPFPTLGNASHLATETDAQESAAPWPYQYSGGGGAAAGYYREDDIRQEDPIEVEDRVRGFRVCVQQCRMARLRHQFFLLYNMCSFQGLLCPCVTP
jgi:hypothetical protein